jgi:hypothetical protein
MAKMPAPPAQPGPRDLGDTVSDLLPRDWNLPTAGYRTLTALEIDFMEKLLAEARKQRGRQNTVGAKYLLFAADMARKHFSGIDVDTTSLSEWMDRL